MKRLTGRLNRLRLRHGDAAAVREFQKFQAEVCEVGVVADWLRQRGLSAADALPRGLTGPRGLRHFSLAKMAEIESALARWRLLRTLEQLDRAERRLRDAEAYAAVRGEEADHLAHCRRAGAELRGELGLAEGQTFADNRAEYETLRREHDERDQRPRAG